MSIASGVFKLELCETEINFHCAFFFLNNIAIFFDFLLSPLFAFAFATCMLYAAAAFDYSSCSAIFFFT